MTEEDDEFYKNFKPRGPNDPVPSWALPNEGFLEAMETVPLFMTHTPQVDEVDSNPALSALQSLLYEDTPDVLTENHLNSIKEEWKALTPNLETIKKYIEEAFAANSSSAILKADLYVQRAKLELKKGNYGKTIIDCNQCYQLESTNIKARKVHIKALLALNRVEEAYELCQEASKTHSDNRWFMDRQSEIRTKMKEKEHKETLKRLEQKYREHQYNVKRIALLKRGVELITMENNDLLKLYFPLMPVNELPSLQYFSTQDKFTDVDEDSTLTDLLAMTLSPRPEWDIEDLYYSSCHDEYRAYVPLLMETEPYSLVSVSCTLPLKEVFNDVKNKRGQASSNYKVLNGILIFIVLPRFKAKQEDRKWLQEYRILS